MRTTILSGVLMFSTLILSNCSKKENLKEETSLVKEEPVSLTELFADPCPPGTHPVLSYEFNQFRFKRPITNCQSGFWFCTTDGQWVITCVPDFPPPATIRGDKAYVWAEVLDSNGAALEGRGGVLDGGHTVRLHFPLALKSSPDYSATDLSTFSVDNEYEIYPGVTLKTGTYNVVDNGYELIITVDL